MVCSHNEVAEILPSSYCICTLQLFNDSNPGSSSPYSPAPLNGTSFSSNHAVSTSNGVSGYGTLLLPSLPASTPALAPPTKRSRHDQPPPPVFSSTVSTSDSSILGPVPDDPEVMLARLGEIAATTGGKGDGTSENPLNKAIPWEWKEKVSSADTLAVSTNQSMTMLITCRP